jgi:hypothetical protein
MRGILIVHLLEDSNVEPEAELAACLRMGTSKAIDPGPDDV